MHARQIIAEARELGVDPIEWTLDLADGYGWDEGMTEDAVESVRAALASYYLIDADGFTVMEFKTQAEAEAAYGYAYGPGEGVLSSRYSYPLRVATKSRGPRPVTSNV